MELRARMGVRGSEPNHKSVLQARWVHLVLQALFRLIDAMIGDVLPAGYRFDVDANSVARAVLGKSTWAVLALTLDIELFTQIHYRESIGSDAALPELFKGVFLLFH
jgi:hypothetical protein